jgi:hypothetical protein
MMLGLALTTLIANAAAPTASASNDAPLRFAVVVGYAGNGSEGRAVLSYADDDAARAYVAELPESERAWLLTTFDAESARLFPDLTQVAQPPTKEELSHALGEAFWSIRNAKEAGKRTEFVFYFAGHGDVSPSGEGYVELADGPFTRSELAAQIVRGSPADVNHVIIDACASYFMVKSRGADDAATKPVPLTPELLTVVKPDVADDEAAWARTGTLVSTSDAASVHESAELGGGVFSYLLRSALAGGADVNGDGRVEYGEAAAFIASASAQIPDPRARLRVHATAPTQRPHAALADLSRGDRRFLAVDVPSVDHVRILDEHGLPYAEVHKGRGDKILIALAGSPFFTVQLADKEATLVPRTAGAYALSSLRFEPSPKPRGGFEQGPFGSLFSTSFDRSYVDGYLASDALPMPLARDNTSPFVVAFAPAGEPPFRWPFGAIAIGSFATAGVLAIVGGTSAVLNLTAYNQLQQGFRTSATVDPNAAFQVDAWRATSTIATAGAVVTALAGAGFWALSSTEEP